MPPKASYDDIRHGWSYGVGTNTRTIYFVYARPQYTDLKTDTGTKLRDLPMGTCPRLKWFGPRGDGLIGTAAMQKWIRMEIKKHGIAAKGRAPEGGDQ